MIRDLLASERPTLSYEVYPPRTADSEQTLWSTLESLASTRPDFVSITYGASGSTRTASQNVVHRVGHTLGVPALAHLTCVDQSVAEITTVIECFLEDGVRDFLALRGDPPKGVADWTPHPEGLLYASQLVTLIREVGHANGIDNLSIGVTAFPAAPGASMDTGLEVLRLKQEAGADFAVTQLFYEAAQYTHLLERAKDAGIGLPVLPGIIPLTTAKRARRMEQLTGVPSPADVLAALDAAADDDEAREIGVAAAAGLSEQLLDAGAPGLHVYTFNTHTAAEMLVGRLPVGA